MMAHSVRDDMVFSTIELFAQKGIGPTKLTDVTTHANAPRGSIYHYFPAGKPQLAEEAIHRAGVSMGKMISSGLANSGQLPTLKAIISMFREQLVKSDFAAGCPVAAGCYGGFDYDAARQAAADSFSSWEETIASSLWHDGIERNRARSLATAAIAMIEGALLLCRAQRSTQALDRIETEIIHTIEGLPHL